MGDTADPAAFVEAFTGSHRYILEYLLEEAFSRQPVAIQTFCWTPACWSACQVTYAIPP
jgi:hypothetical protein